MTVEPPRVRVRRLRHGRSLPLPGPASAGSAGLDLRAAVEGEVILAPGERQLVPTGLVFELPAGWEGQVRPRSGLAVSHGIALVNSPGTLDSDYRGELKVLLINHGAEPFVLRRGDRIAQLVIAPALRPILEEAERLTETGRGEAGFGSTGVE